MMRNVTSGLQQLMPEGATKRAASSRADMPRRNGAEIGWLL